MPSPKQIDVGIELDAATLEYFKATWPHDYAHRMAIVLKAYASSEKTKFIPVERLFAEWQKDPEYRHEYEALRAEFEEADRLIRERTAGVSDPVR